MKTLLVLTDSEQADAMIRWTGRLAESCFSPLAVLCVFESATSASMVPVSEERMISGQGLLRTARSTLRELGLEHCTLLELHHSDPVTAILESLEKEPHDLVVCGAVRRKGDGDDDEPIGERLFRFAPCESRLVDPGFCVPLEKSRILVPLGSSQIKPALKFSLELVRRGARWCRSW